MIGSSHVYQTLIAYTMSCSKDQLHNHFTHRVLGVHVTWRPALPPIGAITGEAQVAPGTTVVLQLPHLLHFLCHSLHQYHGDEQTTFYVVCISLICAD